MTTHEIAGALQAAARDTPADQVPPNWREIAGQYSARLQDLDNEVTQLREEVRRLKKKAGA